MSGLRRGELFALRWRDFDEERQSPVVREAVYDGTFSTPKTAAGVRQIPLSDAAVKLVVDWRARVKRTEPESLMFSTWSGKPIRRTTSCVSGPFQRATLWDCNA